MKKVVAKIPEDQIHFENCIEDDYYLVISPSSTLYKIGRDEQGYFTLYATNRGTQQDRNDTFDKNNLEVFLEDLAARSTYEVFQFEDAGEFYQYLADHYK
jgi:hypothetical protein